MADPKLQLNPVTVNFVDTSTTVSQSVPVTAANPLPVTLTTGTTDQDVNLVGINGVAPVTGSGTATAALRVELPTNGTGTVGLNAGTNNIGDVDVLTNVYPTPVTTAGIAVANVKSGSLETGHVIKSSAGNLFGFTGTTTSAAGYFLIHNATAVPSAGAVTPDEAFYCGAFGSVSRTWEPPLRLGTGISISFSIAVTPFTQTNSATAFISGQAV